jgi:hypothetical protein
MNTRTETRPDVTTAVAGFIRYLETAVAPEGLFADDLFGDVTLPLWRLQSDTREGLLAIRQHGHPWAGRVSVGRVDPIEDGFVIEVEERWEDGGQQWYCREMMRALVRGATIVELSVYCTGDWDEAQQQAHASAVTLIRP